MPISPSTPAGAPAGAAAPLLPVAAASPPPDAASRIEESCPGRATRSWTDWLAGQLGGPRPPTGSRRKGA